MSDRKIKSIHEIVGDLRLMPYPEKAAILAAINYVDTDKNVDQYGTIVQGVLKEWQRQSKEFMEGFEHDR